MKSALAKKPEPAPSAQHITLLADSSLQVSDAEMKDAVDYAKITGKLSLERQLKSAEEKLSSSQEEVKVAERAYKNDLVPHLREQARAHPRIEQISKALRGLSPNSVSTKFLVESIDIGTRYSGYSDVEDLGRWCDGKRAWAKVHLPVSVSDANGDSQECFIELTLKLPEDVVHLYEILHCALLKRAEDFKVVQAIKKKLEELPKAVKAVRAAVLEQRLNRTETGKLALEGVQTHISAFLDGRYESLLPG
jgi:hypothetical protein